MSKRWKRVELKFARDVGTERIPVTGVDREGADFADGLCVYQAKSRKTIPGWLWGWLEGIRATGKRTGRQGVLVLHKPGQDRKDALVVLSWQSWTELHGEPEAPNDSRSDL